MKRYLKFASVGLALIGVVLMFFTQVVVKWGVSGIKESIDFHALVGGNYSSTYVKGVAFNGVGSGLAGYILAASGALIILITVLIPYLKEHDVLSMVVTGIGVICLIIGAILIFFIRKNFADANGILSGQVYVGWAAIAAGSCVSLAAGLGALGMMLDLAGTN